MNDTQIGQNPQRAKIDLRQRMQDQRDAAPAEQRAEWSRRICEHALATPAYQAAQVVHVFLSIRSEVDTRPLIEHALSHGKRVVLPVFLKSTQETPCTEITSLAEDAFKLTGFGLRVPKVRRPVPLQQIDWVWVPLLAFQVVDGATHRIGYGAGYYDRFLAQVQVPKVGLAFEMQHATAVAQWEIEPHDVPLDFVITEIGRVGGAQN